mgnify:FL=1
MKKKLIIKNCLFLNEEINLSRCKFMLMENGVITLISNTKPKINAEIFDAKNYLITPSFVNAHFHLGETIYKDYANTSSLKNYLEDTENINKLFKPSSHHIISEVSLLEAIKHGTSIISCSRGWNATKKSGLRGDLGFPLMKSDKLKQFFVNFEKQFSEKSKEFPIQFQTNNNQIVMGLWIHSLNMIDESALKKAAIIFKKNKNISLTLHLAETKEQTVQIKNKYGLSEIELLEKHGLLNKRTNLIHCNHLSLKDVSLIAKKKANITICPVSNKILSSGFPNLELFLKKGINVSIGTDGLATTESASLLQNAKRTKELLKIKISDKELIKMITINPAKTLGFSSGIIKEELFADLNFFKIKNDKTTLKDLLNENLILEHLIIDGKFVMKKNKILTLNEQKIKKDFQKLVSKVKKYKADLESIKNNNLKLFKSEKGNNIDFVKKQKCQFKVALGFNSEYRYAIQTPGFQQIYFLINKHKDFFCERFYYPDKEIISIHKRNNIPLLTEEGNTELNKKELLFFSFNYEGNYPKFFEMLNLSNLPALSKDRNEKEPLLIGGGITLTYNPEPLAPFFDIIIIGEAEPVIPKLLELYKSLKTKGFSKKRFLSEAYKIPSVYIPSLKKKTILKAVNLDINIKQEASIISPFSYWPNFLFIETTRGCNKGCRFCVLTQVFDKMRHKSSQNVKELLKKMSKFTKKARFVTPSDTYHPNFKELYQLLNKHGYTVEMGSVRADSLNTPFFKEILTKNKIPKLTIAPEAASERMRKIIKKNISNKDLFISAEIAGKYNIKELGVFYIIGFPKEEESDRLEIINLKKQLRKKLDSKGGKKTIIKVTINSHIKKPHTYFEKYAQQKVEEYETSITNITKELKKIPNIIVQRMDKNLLALEGFIVRGTAQDGLKLFEIYNNKKNINITYKDLKDNIKDFNKYFKPKKGKLPWWFVKL